MNPYKIQKLREWTMTLRQLSRQSKIEERRWKEQELHQEIRMYKMNKTETVKLENNCNEKLTSCV